MMIGAQLFTLRNYLQNEKDFRFTMKKVAEIGYKSVQLSAIGPIRPEFIRETCDEFGLKIVLTHSKPDRILNDTDALIKEHDILGCDYIGIGMMPDKYRTKEWLEHFAMDYKEPAKKIAAAGKKFMYHNHNVEFEKFDGKRIIETLMEDFTAEEMGFTLDTYWVQAGGADIYYWIDALKDRIPCVHLKDMSVKGWEYRMAAVGSGNMNFPKIMEAFEKTGCVKYALVEQDDCYGESPFDCLKSSYDYLNTLGYR